jgi:hypothetical protein
MNYTISNRLLEVKTKIPRFPEREVLSIKPKYIFISDEKNYNSAISVLYTLTNGSYKAVDQGLCVHINSYRERMGKGSLLRRICTR